MITVPEDKVRDLVKEAYNLSRPVGMGFLHFDPDPLTEEEVDQILANSGSCVAAMDYVKGRQCKFGIYRNAKDDTFEISDHWYDHSDAQYVELLTNCGIEVPKHLTGDKVNF